VLKDAKKQRRFGQRRVSMFTGN